MNILSTDKPLTKDVFFRSHVVQLKTKDSLVSTYNESKWPEFALVFDTETSLEPREQALLFGFYRVCRLRNNIYECIEEGIIHADNLKPEYLAVIASFKQRFKSEVVGADYDEEIHVCSRSEFVEKV